MPVSTNEIVTKVVGSLKSQIDSCAAKVTFHDLPRINGDPFLLRQLFQNPISNAIKFREEERAPDILIEAKEEPKRWRFSVQDNGIGFDPDNKESLFKLFKKVHLKRSHEGYGIGLATARKIVELHGGSIWAESQPGIGSTFFFTLQK